MGKYVSYNDHYPNSSEERVMLAESNYITRLTKWNQNQTTLSVIYSQIDHNYNVHKRGQYRVAYTFK